MRKTIAALCFCLSGLVLSAVPSLAVLDISIPEGMDSSAQVPITEKIMEVLVGSKQYTVLDRSYVNKVLEEQEFKLSGLVDTDDIRKIGGWLSADQVCVGKITEVGSAYFLSAKIIDVNSGAILVQVSDEAETGDLAIVIKMAGNVGLALTGQAVAEQTETDTAGTDTSGAADTGTGTGSVTDDDANDEDTTSGGGEPAPKKAFGKAVILLPGFANTGAIWDAAQLSHDNWANYIGSSDWGDSDIGAQLKVALPLFNIAYLSAGATMQYKSVSFDGDYDSPWGDFLILDLFAHGGVMYPLLDWVQAYAGLGVGYAGLTLGDYWEENEGATQFGTSFGFELGADMRLLDFLAVSVNVQYSGIRFGDDQTDISSSHKTIGYFAFSVGTGIAF